MNFTPTFGWYYRSAADRAPAFTGVEAFWNFFTGDPEFTRENGGIGPFGIEVERDAVEIGDAVQLGDAAGDFYHTLLVTDIREGALLVSAHSNDTYNRPLSSYDASAFRFLHIEGVRFSVEGPTCFAELISGRQLPSN